MKSRIGTAVLFLLVACGQGVHDVSSSPQPDESRMALSAFFSSAPVCPGPAAPGTARCHSWIRVDSAGNPVFTSSPSGYNPDDLQTAYNLVAASSADGIGATVAIVDAFDDPNAESDLAVYRSTFGLPPCTTLNGCFHKVDQTGGTNYPRASRSWAEEISVDLDMVSAICPNCHILLVEATTNSFADLAAAVDYAASVTGVVAIGNSYGSSGEFSSETSLEQYYNRPVAITASSGDSGYGVEYPAASQYVTAVGGTTLNYNSSTKAVVSETVWSGAGSGCSAFIPQPPWQTSMQTSLGLSGCNNRIVADAAAVADPNTGVSVYDTFHQHGWLVFGGTSVSAQIIAAVYALATSNGTVTYGSYPYSHTSGLNDIIGGSNGTCSPYDYLCTGVQYYDGPTGWGTPNGTSGF